MRNVSELERLLDEASTTARELTQACFAAARDPSGEGGRVYTESYQESALIAAERADERRRRGEPTGPLEGIPVSVKDLFDVAGTVTRAASPARPEAQAAGTDAAAVAALRSAGAIIIGKTNMTEFAYSGLGLNPHFGTPLNPYDRAARRIPGGSSSGAAVSVSDGMAVIGLGSDTGGSVRIPAALCGLTGWKPTVARVSREGVLPLSRSFDSVGPIAADVATCACVDRILSGDARIHPGVDLARTRLAIPRTLRTLDTDAAVARAIDRALSHLGAAGADLIELDLPQIEGVPAHGQGPLILAAEAYTGHRPNLERNGRLYDPRVRARLELGASLHAWQYLDALDRRTRSIAAAEAALAGFDAWLMPTVPIIAPRLAELEDDEAYVAINRLVLRNSAIVNFLGGCAASLPCHEPGEPPVGLTVAGPGYADARILALAASIESALGARLRR